MKKLTLLFGVALLTLTSCSKTDNNPTASGNTDALVLLKTVNDGTNPVTPLTYNGNKIVTDGDITYTYTGDLITRYDVKDDDYIGRTDFTYDGNGNLISEVFSNNGGMGTVLNLYNKRDFTYNNDGTVTGQTYNYNNSSSTFVVSETTKYTFENGNIIKEESIDATNGISNTTVYEYDTKNNPLRNITGWNVFFVDSSCKNNVTKSTFTVSSGTAAGTHLSTYVYTYNDKGYPLTVQETDVQSNEGSAPTTTVANTTYGY